MMPSVKCNKCGKEEPMTPNPTPSDPTRGAGNFVYPKTMHVFTGLGQDRRAVEAGIEPLRVQHVCTECLQRMTEWIDTPLTTKAGK